MHLCVLLLMMPLHVQCHVSVYVICECKIITCIYAHSIINFPCMLIRVAIVHVANLIT